MREPIKEPAAASHAESWLQFDCPKGPTGWVARWVGPPAAIGLRTMPRFCPWCGERIDTHNNYEMRVETGASEAVPDAA